MDVLTDNDAILLLLQYLFMRIGEPDALALRAVVRLDDIPPLLLLFLSAIDEDAGLVGQDEGLREEAVLSRKSVLHLR